MTSLRNLLLVGSVAASLAVGFAGCGSLESVTQLGTSLGQQAGLITKSQAEAANKVAAPLAKSFEDITPEQEYYIGRTVGAVVLTKYEPFDNLGANRYLNQLGQALAQASDRPETFGGYRFLILDSDEVNAFAAPGGLVFVTRGMIACCPHEDALAAVLAHEIGHVNRRHGLKAIRTARLTSALTILATEGAKTFGGQDLAKLTESFEGSISDITSTLVNNGYSRALEQEADEAAVGILERVGYNRSGLLDMLDAMKSRLQPGGLDFAKTHPSPQIRIDDVMKRIGARTPVQIIQARQDRFAAALGGGA